MEVPTSFADKYAWLREHFPFIPSSHIVFCGDKGVLDVDYLIDDTSRHFDRFRGTPLLFSAPHNQGERRFRRLQNWGAVAQMFLGSRDGHRREAPAGPKPARRTSRSAMKDGGVCATLLS